MELAIDISSSSKFQTKKIPQKRDFLSTLNLLLKKLSLKI